MSEVTIPDVPISRVEQYLNNIATGSGALPPYPISRKEQYLAKIAENGGGGGSATWGSITGTLSNQTDLSELLDTIVNGTNPPKMAVNLTTSDKVNSNDAFVVRTTAGDESIANGPSTLVSVNGNNSTPTHTSGSATQSKTEAVTASITFVDPTTLTEDSYTLSYDGTNWSYNVSTISLADYGITLTGAAYSGDSITIAKTEGVYSAVYNRVDRLTVSFSASTWMNKAELAGMSIGSYAFAYDGTNWKLSGSTVTMSDYGITVTGTAVNGDTITVNYATAPTYGTIAVATPQHFISTGFNSFNPDDVLNGYTIDASGNIVAQSGKYVGFAVCLSGTNAWIVGHASTIDKVAYNASKPTTATTGMTILTKNNAMSEEGVYNGNPYYNDGYTIANAGYIVFCGSTLELVCTHPRWSGKTNWNEGGNADYAAYDADVEDLVGKTLTRNITRVAYTRATLNQLLTDHPTWVRGTDYEWDSSYIYYVASAATTETYAANSGLWSVGTTRDTIALDAEENSNDYGVEYFTDTTRAAYASIVYSANLKDQFRHAVRYDGQVLTDAQKEAARITIGVNIAYSDTLPATAAVNTIYSLGTQSTITTTLPAGTTVGDIISIIWYNGATPATVTITGTMIPFTYTPTANTRSEINAMWDGTNWCLVSNEQAVTASE